MRIETWDLKKGDLINVSHNNKIYKFEVAQEPREVLEGNLKVHWRVPHEIDINILYGEALWSDNQNCWVSIYAVDKLGWGL